MSQDYSRNLAYGRERDLELPVPNFNSSDHSVRSNSLSDVDRRSGPHRHNNDIIFGEAYISSEQSDSPSSSKSQVQEGYMGVSNQREESIRSHGFNYQVPQSNVYNMTDAPLAPQHPPEMPPRHLLRPHSSTHSGVDEMKKNANTGQKAPPSKQIEDYKKKASLLRQELETLKDQRNLLRGDGNRSPSPDTKKFLKENTKLQLEIQNKLKTINNVLDVMNGIIGYNTDSRELQSPEIKPKQKWCQKFNYVFYDPEMHWCRVCNIFPQTAKDYLSHLHAPDHQTTAAEHVEAPWHSVPGTNEGYPSLPTAPTKRTPIRGLQFFVPATAWYCKLCDQFIGDLHCASAHIKSIVHSKNYNKFVQQNPHWETDWVSDRQRAFERARADARLAGGGAGPQHQHQHVKYVTHTLTISKEMHTKRPPKTPPLELEEQQRYIDTRKPERGSAPSSPGNSGSEPEDTTLKDRRLKSIEMGDNKELEKSESAASVLSDHDRKLLETLKTRMKMKDERQRSSSRDKERNRDMQQRMKDSECRGRSSERRERSRHRRERPARRASRDTRAGSRERDRRNSRDRRGGSRDQRAGSRDRRGGSRDRRGGSRDRRGGSRDRRGGSRDRRGGSRDRRRSRDRQNGSQATESKEQSAPTQSGTLPRTLPMPTAAMPKPVSFSIRMPTAAMPKPVGLPLPMPTAAMPKPVALPMPTAAMPKPVALPARAAIPPPAAMPPVMMPLPQSLLPPGGSLPEFQEALELLFPTDPAKCAEMLAAMQQQPSLLGAPPPLPLPYPLGFPPMFPFDFSAGSPGLLPSPAIPQLPVGVGGAGGGGAGGAAHEPARRQRPGRGRGRGRDDELVMLGIDASDVGAGA